MSAALIPPFPAQDLAKLVLGYLAEEQLMTAYDEFLQASPYLDALKNEYDRIFMTSLKNILAEYRAVKIYVESCKPVVLRRRLFGCANLLEVVKFLIQNFDYNKLQLSESSGVRNSSANTSTTSASILSKLPDCDVCSALRLPSCVCIPKTVGNSQTALQNYASSDTSVETTALEDLPGNQCQTKKGQVKLLEKISKVSISSTCDQNTGSLTTCEENVDKRSVSSFEQGATTTLSSNAEVQSTQDISMSRSIQDQIQNNQPTNPKKIEEFSNILTTVCGTRRNIDRNNINLENENSRLSSGTFQDFASGVHGNNNAVAKTMPDSSTTVTENSTLLSKSTDAFYQGARLQTDPRNTNPKPLTKATILLTVGSVKNTSLQKDASNHGCHLKQNEQKVTILSDIKVDKTYHSENTTKMPYPPPVLKNATSTPLMQMQTILINGTPAYKQDTKNMKLAHYTKDEIMAMPTIILVPSTEAQSSGGQQKSTEEQDSKSDKPGSTARRLGSLMIDVSSSNTITKENNLESQGLPSLGEDPEPVLNEASIKTLALKNASMPKDVTENSNKCTPHSQAPIRKSSSTPRRNSHVRVLDFTTPRRILQDTINEHSSEQNSNNVEITVDKSPSLNNLTNEICTEQSTIDENSKVNSLAVNSTCLKENQDTNKTPKIKRSNWDADLRALALAHQGNTTETKCETFAKRKTPRAKKKDQSENSKDPDKTSDKKPKRKPKKKTEKCEENKQIEKSGDDVTITKDIPVKPTINIVSKDWNEEHKEKLDKSKNKSDDDQIETPDVERLSLQNAIGAKLNISDFLETPYKQALYDIQMETPRFLGPDIPGEPLSDIKIMSIPTPRFLSSPKQGQPTPSSYSSRPTDYSSGGSYYKPEEQDYLRVDDLEYPENNIENKIGSINKQKSNESETQPRSTKSSRPVRKCTKNISYRSSSKNYDKVENSSESSSRNSVSAKIDKELIKTPKEVKQSEKTKTESKKRSSVLKKRRTPIKKDKPFIKLKPRRVTPVKDSERSKGRLSELQSRKRTSSKESFPNATPAAALIPTKSRRKSSTPRKLHCTKTFTSESSGHESPELVKHIKNNEPEITVQSSHDSDTEQLPLRWSDDGSQDTKLKEQVSNRSTNDSEDIGKIQKFIAESGSVQTALKERESNLHIDLVKRGFDIETAKIIERDLLDMPPFSKDTAMSKGNVVAEPRQFDVSSDKFNQSDTSTSVHLHIDEDKDISQEDEEEEEEEIELSVQECNEETENFIICCHDENSNIPKLPPEKLKDKFTMEVCIDDGISIRLRATPFSLLLDEDPKDIETEMAVSSIPTFDKLYTPMKNAVRAQCYEIFDSTLTSLDTPLKVNSPKKKECEMMVTEIVLEIEKEEVKDIRSEGQKRKRDNSENTSEESNEVKKTKPDPQYLLNSASIQNIDIETVLSKLHGP